MAGVLSLSCGQSRSLVALSSLDNARKCRNAELGEARYSRDPPAFVETCHGKLPSLSVAKIRPASPTCFRQFTHDSLELCAFPLFKAGIRTPINTTMTAITTTDSSNVKAVVFGLV